MKAVAHLDAAAFLARARPWLEAAEDEHNLVLGLATALTARPAPADDPDAPFFATAEEAGAVVGCAFRTPPHKLVLTRMPEAAVRALVALAAERFETVPGVMGPADVVRTAGEAWVARRGGTTRPGMKMRMYRLDEVWAPLGIPGARRTGGGRDLPLAHAWAEAFAREAGHEFATASAMREAWVREGRLHLWEDEGTPVSMAVHTGATRRGVRIGYVYTPPERRGRGYASALVAAVSKAMLDAGFAFCVLYTDRANPVPNAIYPRVGYRALCEVEDVLIERGR